MINVSIVDDHPIVRAGLRAILERAPDIRVLGEGSCGADALRMAAENPPDVLVLDINLPDIDGLEVTRRLCSSCARFAILILTVHKDAQTVMGSLECGAIGYVLKDEALETLESAVRAAACGDSWLSPPVASTLVNAAKRPQSPKHDFHESLTKREKEILALLATGLDNSAIAGQLVLTKRTVQNHISNIYGKLGVNSRTEALLLAQQFGYKKGP